MTVPDFAALVAAVDGPCVEWPGTISTKGYGVLTVNGRQVKAHRWVYEREVGPIPNGLTLDHLCRNRRCVNPAHLEPVTVVENVMRGESPQARNARKMTCGKGHPLVPLYGQRGCRECERAANTARARRSRRRKFVGPKTCCGKTFDNAHSWAAHHSRKKPHAAARAFAEASR